MELIQVLPSNVAEEVSISHNQSRSVDQNTSPMGAIPTGAAPAMTAAAAASAASSSSGSYIHHDMPEMEQLEVELVKDSQV